MSLDVINLFTNIPMDYTLEILKDELKIDVSLRDRTSLPIEDIIFLVRLCMENNFFPFNEKQTSMYEIGPHFTWFMFSFKDKF